MDANSQPTGPTKVMARATFAYTAAADDELSFEVGDLITVHEQCEDGWWVAEINEKIGVFPYNYVEVISDGAGDAPSSPPDGPASDKPKETPDPSNDSSLDPPDAGGSATHDDDKPSATPPDTKTSSTTAASSSESSAPASESADRVLKQGYLMKKGHVRRNWNKRWFILRGKTLSYYASPGDKTPKGEITISPDSKVGSAEGLKKPEEHPYCLQLTNVTPMGKEGKTKDGFVFYMDASNADDMQQWMDAVVLAQKVAFGDS